MMNLYEFTEEFLNELMDVMPKEYQDMEMRMQVIDKVNTEKHGITFIGKTKGTQVSPTLYVEDMYEYYKTTEDMEEVLQYASDIVCTGLKNKPAFDLSGISEILKATDRIFFKVVNTYENSASLQKMPHREILDLSVIYGILLDKDMKDSIMTIKITNEIAKNMGLSEKELFHLAYENTKKLFPPCVMSMNDMLKVLMDEMGCLEAVMCMPDVPLYIITNEPKINGAGMILYDEVLYELATKLESDLYLLPSSVHETIALPVDPERGIEEYANMVLSVNAEAVSLEDRLSNQVYRYDRASRTVCIGSENQKKLTYN